jgi:hypothetical protein
VLKYNTAGEATEDNMTHAHSILDTLRYRYALTMCHTYCFSTGTMVVRTRLNVTFNLHCLSCNIRETTARLRSQQRVAQENAR